MNELTIPKVSIIIPTFNRSVYLEDTVNSIIQQTFQEWELIIVDDGSLPVHWSKIKIIEEHDNRIRVFQRKTKPKGANNCRNIGFSKSNSNFLLFLDSDDILSPNCLKNRLETASANQNQDFWVFNSITFAEDGKKNLWNIETEEDDLNRFLRLDGVWNQSSPLYSKAFLNKIPQPIFKNLPFLQDWKLAITCLVNKASYKKFL